MKNIMEMLKTMNAVELKKDDKLIVAQTYLFLFLTGAIIGWFYELFFYWITEDRISNNGFFYGPYLPIYGFGTVLIILFTKKFKKHPAVIFLLSIPITGILEYFTGYAMYKIWAARWWDYRGMFLNIDGYVCIRSVLSFAVGAILLLYVVEPMIIILSNKMSAQVRRAVCAGIMAIFVIDIIATILYRMPAFV